MFVSTHISVGYVSLYSLHLVQVAQMSEYSHWFGISGYEMSYWDVRVTGNVSTWTRNVTFTWDIS